jgi:transcription antitermination factor NusG
MPWYVLHTKPRNEKKVAQLLEKLEVNVYCPLQDQIRQWSDRKKKIAVPIFRSYVFVWLQDYKSDSLKVLTTPGVINFLWWNKKPGVVRDEEIESIRNFLNNYKNAEIETVFEAGEKVIISEGPLKDMEGTIVKVKGNKAYLNIRSLGLAMTATLPTQALDKQ